MTFDLIKKFGRGLIKKAPAAAAIAAQLGIPYAGLLGAIIQAASNSDTTGSERMQQAQALLIDDLPTLVRTLEKQVGKPISDEAILAYTRALLQAHYDLLKSLGELPKP